jgi:predicted transposase/invertase (TIGR01784 family)
MAGSHQPHDHFFRATFGRAEVASGFARHYLPASIRETLDLRTLRPLKDTFVDAELREHSSDLLYRVATREGQAAYVYLLFEHKSYPEPLTAFQVLRYMVRIWERLGREQPGARFPPIVPVVLYHGASRWHAATRFAVLVDTQPALTPHIPDFEYVLCDLSTYSDAALVGGVMEQVALLVLKHIFDAGGEWDAVLPRLMELLAALDQARDGLAYIQIVLRYLASAAQRLQPDVLRAAVDRMFPEDGGTLMDTIAQEWIRQGREQGREQGLEQGREQGLEQGREQGLEQGREQGKALGALDATRENVLSLLELRFGKVTAHTAAVLARVDDLGQMKALFKQAATAEDLAAFEESLPA